MLSDFLTANGGIKLKKACSVRNNIWERMINNQAPPSVALFHRIVDHLSSGSPAKKKAYTDALWGEILKLWKPTRSINLTVMKKPMAAPRPRFRMNGRFPRAYNPPKYTQWKREFALLVGHIGRIVGPCRIYVEYHEKAKTLALGPHQKQMDIDNFDKAFLDALQVNGLLEDDKDVYWMDSRKYSSYADFIRFQIFFDEIWTNEKEGDENHLPQNKTNT